MPRALCERKKRSSKRGARTPQHPGGSRPPPLPSGSHLSENPGGISALRAEKIFLVVLDHPAPSLGEGGVPEPSPFRSHKPLVAPGKSPPFWGEGGRLIFEGLGVGGRGGGVPDH